MTYKKYSKSSSFYANAKKDFFSTNEKLLKQAHDQNSIYAAQPRRKNCKICGGKLAESTDFSSHGIGYVFCENCGHLNGEFDDTQDFIEKMYIADSGLPYSKNYIDENFLKRVEDVYLPKVRFLTETLGEGHLASVLDVGCGSGYFVLASLMCDLDATGIDVSDSMVSFGNQQIQYHHNESPLQCLGEDGFYQAIMSTDAQVVSAIGVIEHLREPHRFFEAFKESGAEYLYYSVPMYSLSVILENTMSDVFPRQLSGGHTHLFTEQSLKVMHDLLDVKPVAEWRFGTDVMDLYRHLLTKLQKNDVSDKVLETVHEGLGAKIDDLQTVFDQHHFCSEIHVIASKR